MKRVKRYAVAAGFGLIAVALGQMLYIIGSALFCITHGFDWNLGGPHAALWAYIGVGEVPASATFIGGTIVFRRVLGRLLNSDRCGWFGGIP